ncbi:MAG: zf-HC2 domain-containing protein [Planctomycetes bacterium]|nr:zf-HC2 domain-containing protein [Planctomycetota bacterium]
MTCTDARRLTSLHLDSELSAERAADLARHIESCASCAERVGTEERLERRIRESLRRPGPGDDEAWRQAVGAIPRRRWWIPAAAAIVVAAAVLLLARPRELDLAATMAEHHAHYLEGKSPLAAGTADPSEASRYFRDKLPFPCAIESPLPSDTKLVGARMCYLDGAPTAFYILHRDRTVVTVAVFAAADVTRFPMASSRLEREEIAHCRVGNLAFVATKDGDRVVTAVGDVPPAELERIVRAFLARVIHGGSRP